MDCLSSPDVKNALDKIHKDFVVVPIDKTTGNIALVCKRFYASVITRELGLINNSSTDRLLEDCWWLICKWYNWWEYKRFEN